MSVLVSDNAKDKLCEILEEAWEDSRDGETERLLDILEQKEYYLYHFKDTEHGTDDRFVWAEDSDTAKDKLEEILYDEDEEIDIDWYECQLVYDTDGNEVKKVYTDLEEKGE